MSASVEVTPDAEKKKRSLDWWCFWRGLLCDFRLVTSAAGSPEATVKTQQDLAVYIPLIPGYDSLFLCVSVPNFCLSLCSGRMIEHRQKLLLVVLPEDFFLLF